MPLTPLPRTLDAARAHTLALVEHLSRDDLERTVSELMSPVVWDLGHIAAFEDLWTSRAYGVQMLAPELAATYDAAETPRADRGTLALLDTPAALAYLEAVSERTRSRAGSADDALVRELVRRHELQHGETMLQTFQIGGLPAPPAFADGPPRVAGAPATGLELLPCPGGQVEVGAPAEGFAYDNERPRHAVDLPPFAIGRGPVTVGDWEAFADDGGYARPELWSAEGWAWRCDEFAEQPLSWTGDGRAWWFDEQRALDPAAPVSHVCWYEAEAFARAHDARLPSEFEWEAAVTGGAGGDPDVAGVGAVWEWTASEFGGYPGFRAHPYREYSEIFFATGMRVLRGGSWAGAPGTAPPTFRNWDLPQRRQIFSGLRLARDAA